MRDFLCRRCATDGCKSIIVGTDECEWIDPRPYNSPTNSQILLLSDVMRGELDDLAVMKLWMKIDGKWFCIKCVRRESYEVDLAMDRETETYDRRN